jgi:hypothetical protein
MGGMSNLSASIIGGLAGLAGSVLGGKGTTTTNGTTNTSGTASTSGTSTSSTNPILSSLQQQLSGAATGNALNANLNATNLTGYTQQGLENINNQNSNQALTAQLEGTGMEYSPAAANAQTSNTLNRINQGNQFLAGVPLLQTQLQQQALSGLNSTFSTLPTATSTSGATTGNQATNSTASTNQTQTSISGILGALGF